MKLYINYNFCGYHWYVINDIMHQPITEITLDEFSYNKEMNRMLKKLITYDSYHLAYMNLDGRYILALRNIREKNRTDENGRKLVMSYIFEGDEKERQLMNKIALTYINEKDFLEQAFSEAISSSVDCVKYDISKLTDWIRIVNNKRLVDGFKFGKGKVLLMLSNWKNETIAENLGIDVNEFVNVKYPSDHFKDIVLLEDPKVSENPDDMEDNSLLIVDESGGVVKPKGLKLKDIIKSLLSDVIAVISGKMPVKAFCMEHCVELLILVSIFSILLGVIIGLCFNKS